MYSSSLRPFTTSRFKSQALWARGTIGQIEDAGDDSPWMPETSPRLQKTLGPLGASSSEEVLLAGLEAVEAATQGFDDAAAEDGAYVQ